MNSDPIVMTMQITHNKINPPAMIPIQAIGRPDSFRWRIRFKEIIPKTSARIPNRKLSGKHTIVVNGNGNVLRHKNRSVKIPKTKLRADCVFIGECVFSSLVSITENVVYEI